MGEEEGFYPHAGVLPPIEPVSQWTFQRKTKQQGGWLRTNLFENPLEFFGFFFTPGNSKENKASPAEIPENCVSYTPHKFSGLKLRLPLGIPHDFFLITHGNSTLLLISRPKIPLAISSITLEIPYPKPPVCFFF